MKNKKGFTLVELLAVIAILAVIGVVAVPNILSLFTSGKKETFLIEAKTIYREAIKKFTAESLKGNTVYEFTSDVNPLDIDKDTIDYRVELNQNGKVVSLIVSNDEYCVKGDNSFLSKEEDIILDTKCDLLNKNFGEKLTIIAGTNKFYLKVDVAYVDENDIEITKIPVPTYPDKEFLGYYYLNESGTKKYIVKSDGTINSAILNINNKSIGNVIVLTEDTESNDDLTPKCKLKINKNNIVFESMSSNVTEYGMNTTGNIEYNSKNSMPISTTTFYGYVKSDKGKTNKCTISVEKATNQIVKTTYTCTKYLDCAKNASEYYNIVKTKYKCNTKTTINYRCERTSTTCNTDEEQKDGKCIKISDKTLNGYNCVENEYKYSWNKLDTSTFVSPNVCGSVLNETCNKDDTTVTCEYTSKRLICNEGGTLNNDKCIISKVKTCMTGWEANNIYFDFEATEEVTTENKTTPKFTCDITNVNKSYYTSKQQIGCQNENYIKYNDTYCYKLGA